MTCIIGLRHADKVYIGADSAAYSRDHVQVTTTPKVFRRTLPEDGGDIVIATTGDYRTSQVLRYCVELPAKQAGQTPTEYLICAFVPALRSCYKEHGCIGKDDDGFDRAGAMIVGFDGSLHTIYADFSVLEFMATTETVGDQLTALGSGWMYALGSMMSTVHVSPIERVKHALAVTAHFDPSVRKPFHVEVL